VVLPGRAEQVGSGDRLDGRAARPVAADPHHRPGQRAGVFQQAAERVAARAQVHLQRAGGARAKLLDFRVDGAAGRVDQVDLGARGRGVVQLEGLRSGADVMPAGAAGAGGHGDDVAGRGSPAAGQPSGQHARRQQPAYRGPDASGHQTPSARKQPSRQEHWQNTHPRPASRDARQHSPPVPRTVIYRFQPPFPERRLAHCGKGQLVVSAGPGCRPAGGAGCLVTSPAVCSAASYPVRQIALRQEGTG
jgi:hypothetical protein